MFGIKTIFLIRIYLFNTVESYPLICPSPSQWRLRSDSFNNCNLGDHYMCLFNESSTSNTELCRKPVVYRKGLKLIWHGDIDADYCREDRFQPFNFWTNGSSTCVNIKSKCNDEGQIKYGNGTGSKDVTCICDSTKGFQFLYKPMNTIYCTPSEEDCTCFANETIQIDINKAVERPNITRLHQHNSATQRITHYVYNAGLVVTILFFIVLGIMTFILVLFWKKEIKDYKYGEGATNETTQTNEEGSTYETIQIEDEGATNETTQRDEKGATNETIQIYEDEATNETIQRNEEGATNNILQTDGEGATNEPIQTDEEGATNETIQRNEEGATNKILQTDGEGATNETTQTDEEGATNITLQTNEEGSTYETIQIDEKGATNETIQIYEDGAENETMQTYEEEIANETIKTDDKEITNETIKTDKEGATNVKNVKILQTDGEGATNETTQTDEEGATNITLQTNEEGATNETTQRDEKGATNETIQIYEDGAENETMQTYEEEIANETIKTDDKEITNETIKTDKEGATNVKNGQLRYKDSDSISETLEVETRKSNNRGTTMDGDPHVARTNRKFTNPVPCSETNSGNDNTIEVEKRNENEELYKDIVDLKVKKANKNWTISGDTSSKHQTELPEFRRRQENRRKHWLDIDTALYHETTSSKEIWKEIEKQDFVSLLIFGPQSCGKSVTAAHIGFKFEQQGYELFFLNLSNEVNERLKVSRRQVFVIDKPLGNQDIEKDLEQWEQLSKSIESTFKNNNTKFIMTLSTRLYKMFEIRLCQTMFGDKRSVVDLSNEEYNLSPDDKKHILQKHKNKGQIKDDESFDEKIMNESVLPHFLIWCNLIANKQTDDIMKEMKEETDLNDLYRKGIQALRNDFNYQYSCLILTVLFDGIFDINELSSVCLEEPCLLVEEKKRSKRMIIAILNSCGLKCDSYDINKHQKSFAELVGTYFKMYPTESEYSILNDVITKSVVRFYGPKNLNIILEYASSTFIAEFVRSVSSKDPTNASVIVVTNNYKEKFAKRLIDDLRDGKISDVFKNPSFEDHKFVSTFGKELDKLDSEQVMTLMEKIPTTSFANSSSLDVCLQFSSPVHWLCRLGLCELLDIVCKKCPQAFIKKIPGQLSPLHFAAGYGNLSVVKYLVEEMHLSTNYTPSHGLQPSPLDYAKHHKHVDVTNYLTTKEPSTTVPRLGKTFISREC